MAASEKAEPELVEVEKHYRRCIADLHRLCRPWNLPGLSRLDCLLGPQSRGHLLGRAVPEGRAGMANTEGRAGTEGAEGKDAEDRGVADTGAKGNSLLYILNNCLYGDNRSIQSENPLIYADSLSNIQHSHHISYISPFCSIGRFINDGKIYNL